jgi:MarR-like DNA-binding transcriptional regulator SgrR of sgrS sRNA
MSIIWIDMHIRDQRVLDWLTDRYGGKPFQVSADRIAQEFKCHRNTATAILWRLQGAGHITIINRAKRGGYVYQLRLHERA